MKGCCIAMSATCQPWNADAAQAHHVYPNLLAGSPLWPLVGVELLEWLLDAVAATPGGCARPLWLAHNARCAATPCSRCNTCSTGCAMCRGSGILRAAPSAFVMS
jgi:hypothetical protein